MINAYASQPHYHDHIWPVWQQLQDRGEFTVHQSIKQKPHDRIAAAPPPDRTPVIVAGSSDLAKAVRRHVIFVEHGAGQTYATAHPGYAGGPGRGRVGLFLCPNEQVAEANRQTYPQARSVVVGSPRVEWLRRRRAGSPWTSRRPVVAFSFHFDCKIWPESRWAYPYYRETFAYMIPKLREDVDVIGHGHPRAWPALKKFWDSLGVEAVQDFGDVVERASVYVCDNSSTIFEAAACNIPVVLLNQPDYRRDVELGLRFWEWADIGPQVDNPTELEATIRDVLTRDMFEARRGEMTRTVYSGVNRSAHRAAVSIAEYVSNI